MLKNDMIVSALLVSTLMAGVSHAADYVREKKWADEVVPGVVVGDPVYIKQANGHEFLALFTPVSGAKKAVIVVHGIGIHPDWGLVGVLRSGLADAGFTTLSIQMPVLANEAKPKDYEPEMPEAAERIALAAKFLQDKGYDSQTIVSHSLGSAMAYRYLAAKPAPMVKAWVSMGISADVDFSTLTLHVLDMFGEKDNANVKTHATERKKALTGKAGSRQYVMPGADHFYTGFDQGMVEAVSGYIKETLGK